ncbi:MAG: ATP-binding protein [Sphaerochaeta sp.]|jgi:DNA replication protein DnaC|nr:ATP-binding protein [Sphaerochaeta sp.]
MSMTDEERRQNWERNRLDQVIRRSGLPRGTDKTRRLDGTFIRTPGNEKAIAAVEDFLGGNVDPPLLLLFGTPGLGKSRLALHIAWSYIEDGSGLVLYYQAEDLLNTLQANQTDGPAYGRLWRGLKEADLVVLDDVGANNATPWRESQLDAILDFRYREALATVITANKLDIPERMLDRLKEGRTAMLKGDSWRGKAADHGK